MKASELMAKCEELNRPDFTTFANYYGHVGTGRVTVRWCFGGYQKDHESPLSPPHAGEIDADADDPTAIEKAYDKLVRASDENDSRSAVSRKAKEAKEKAELERLQEKYGAA
jgi:hypothetical protein